jgi:hypothetical protein
MGDIPPCGTRGRVGLRKGQASLHLRENEGGIYTQKSSPPLIWERWCGEE